MSWVKYFANTFKNLQKHAFGYSVNSVMNDNCVMAMQEGNLSYMNNAEHLTNRNPILRRASSIKMVLSKF